MVAAPRVSGGVEAIDAEDTGGGRVVVKNTFIEVVDLPSSFCQENSRPRYPSDSALLVGGHVRWQRRRCRGDFYATESDSEADSSLRDTEADNAIEEDRGSLCESDAQEVHAEERGAEEQAAPHPRGHAGSPACWTDTMWRTEDQRSSPYEQAAPHPRGHAGSPAGSADSRWRAGTQALLREMFSTVAADMQQAVDQIRARRCCDSSPSSGQATPECGRHAALESSGATMAFDAGAYDGHANQAATVGGA
mmetsp:Transcript_40541/g.114767  ORF Transcript_40541/g.114767 Transcript_40541/m.114767 type:complete len:250 (+) Transcript_40541:88-837(+)